MIDFGKNWPIFFLVGLTIFFFIYIGYKTKKEEKKKKFGGKKES
ncbi:MAG: hypothetical protein ACMUIU_14705 [bacterium]